MVEVDENNEEARSGGGGMLKAARTFSDVGGRLRRGKWGKARAPIFRLPGSLKVHFRQRARRETWPCWSIKDDGNRRTDDDMALDRHDDSFAAMKMCFRPLEIQTCCHCGMQQQSIEHGASHKPVVGTTSFKYNRFRVSLSWHR
jgi:hypothetical protein